MSEPVECGVVKEFWAYLNNILSRVPLFPQVVEKIVCLMDVSVKAELDHFVSKFWMRLITNLEIVRHQEGFEDKNGVGITTKMLSP